MKLRERLLLSLEKRLPDSEYDGGEDVFCPWQDIIQNIDGSYSSECDVLMIRALEAVRDRTTFKFIDEFGLAGDMALYILSGHGLTEYGTSPSGGWPDQSVADLWPKIIENWTKYADAHWPADWKDTDTKSTGGT